MPREGRTPEGREIQLWREVEVEGPGSHIVEFFYEPPGLRTGLLMLGPCAVLTLGLAVFVAPFACPWPDGLDKRWTVSINPLKGSKDAPSERVAQYFIDVVTKIWRIDATEAPVALSNTLSARPPLLLLPYW